jgi:hypothetical protein
MSSIRFGDMTVQLQQQKRAAFEAITAIVYEEPDDDRATELLYAMHVQRLLLAGGDFDDEVVQAGLWCLHDLGVRAVKITDEGKGVEIAENEETSVARGEPAAYGFAAVRDGRAFAAAIANVRTRSMLFNGEMREVHRNPKETVEQVMQLITDVRLVDEELLITTLRVLAALYEQQGDGGTPEHLEAAFELATDLGIDELSLAEDGSIEVGHLNLGNALASAVLQGFDVDEVMALRKRYEEKNAQISPAE